MNKQGLAEAPRELWMAHDQVVSVFQELEDERGGLGNRAIEKTSTAVMDNLEDLIMCLERTSDRAVKMARHSLATKDPK